MILRISALITTQSRTYATNKFRRQPKKLKGAVVKQPQQNNDELSPSEQKHAIKTSEEYQEDPEGFGDLESDFMEAHKSHKQFEAEADRYREQVQLWTVRNKYFKEELPNFLTYAEKQQIKLLHAKDPEEWNAEKLSESFPAIPMTIWKVLKANWVARSMDRIRKHDEHVMRNWVLFRQGKLSVTDDLKEHLQKFAKRDIEDLKHAQMERPLVPQLPKPKGNEFASIITSCAGYRDRQKLIDSVETATVKADPQPPMSPAALEKETFLTEKVVDKRKMRFQDFKKEALEKEPQALLRGGPKEIDNFTPKTLPTPLATSPAKDDKPVDQKEMVLQNFRGKIKNPFKEISVALDNPNGTGFIPSKTNDEPDELVISEEDMKKYEVSTVKERIYIPRKLLKFGATYKVKDCYYDSDGEFLYRVPGMTGYK